MLRLAVVVGVDLLLLAVSAATRRPAPSMPDLPDYLDRWSVLHGGYDPRRAALVGGWLALTYRLARPLAGAGIRPDLVTLWGVAVAAGAVLVADLGGRWALLAAVAVVVTGLLDGLDGCVAVLTGRAGRLGFVLDSLADRVVDGLYLVALWRVGAPAVLCVAAGAGVGLLEYTRVRAGQAGMAEIGVVTVGERPTRVILTTLALASAAVSDPAPVAGAGAAATLAVSLVGLGQLLVVVRRHLR